MILARAIEVRLAHGRGGRAVLSGQDVAVGEVGGGAVATEHVVRPPIELPDQPEKLLLDRLRGRVQRIVHVEAGLSVRRHGHERVVGIGLHDPASYPRAQFRLSLRSTLNDLEPEASECLGRVRPPAATRIFDPRNSFKVGGWK
jgi:hypothetical protein